MTEVTSAIEEFTLQDAGWLATGVYVLATVFSLICAGVFAWYAVRYWRSLGALALQVAGRKNTVALRYLLISLFVAVVFSGLLVGFGWITVHLLVLEHPLKVVVGPESVLLDYRLPGRDAKIFYRDLVSVELRESKTDVVGMGMPRRRWWNSVVLVTTHGDVTFGIGAGPSRFAQASEIRAAIQQKAHARGHLATSAQDNGGNHGDAPSGL